MPDDEFLTLRATVIGGIRAEPRPISTTDDDIATAHEHAEISAEALARYDARR